jgi:aryl-phospho-beta-D-glucosidase BglC (GH1 family)
MRPRALLLATLVLLGACGDDSGKRRPTPTASPLPTASNTASPAATATASAMSPLPSPTASPRPSATSTAPPTATPSVTPTATDPPTPTVPVLEPLAIHADAEWIRDAQGRVVILRGANYSGLEFGNFIGNPHGPQESDFAQMASWGFNMIRLPIAWNYLEPEPTQLDDTYLREQVDPVVAFAAAHGILVVLEMHQFLWSPCFTNGNGAPAWACQGHDYPDNFAGVLRAGCEFLHGVAGADERPLQDHFVDVWRMIARRYAGDQRIAGIDFLNEPSTVACSQGEATAQLYQLYRRLRDAVRAEGATQTFFLEPTLLRNIGTRITTEMFGPDVVYAPHLYTQTGGSADIKYNGDANTITADYEVATAEARDFGGPLFSGEFGGNTNTDGGFRAATELFLRDSLAEQERRLIGGAVWAYFPSDNTFSVVDADGQEKGALVDVLARPYARRIAGVPTAMSFDPDSKEFTFSWRVDAERAGGITEVFVPLRHYPTGPNVQLPIGIEARFNAANQTVLLVTPDPGAYTLRLRP